MARGYRADIAVQLVPASETGTHRRWRIHRSRLLLIRPDGHIGYAGPPGDHAALRSYLDRLYMRE